MNIEEMIKENQEILTRHQERLTAALAKDPKAVVPATDMLTLIGLTQAALGKHESVKAVFNAAIDNAVALTREILNANELADGNFEKEVGELPHVLLTLKEGDKAMADVPPYLAAVGKLIATQDNHFTDQPMFVVFDKEEIVVPEDFDHDEIQWRETESGEHHLASDLQAKRLEALRKGGRYPEGWNRYAVKFIDRFRTACFTEQGCKDYLACNGHNLNRPYIYAAGSNRNYEFQQVRKFLLGLCEAAS